MMFEYRQMNSGGKGQEGMPLAVFVFAQYAFEANEALTQVGGYFGRRDGDCVEAGDQCCGDRWEPVEQGDGFLDDELMELLQKSLDKGAGVYRSHTFVEIEDTKEEVEEFWVVLSKYPGHF
jgi:hypothetical protein